MKKIFGLLCILLVLAGCNTKKTCSLLNLEVDEHSITVKLNDQVYQELFEEETNVIKAIKNNKDNCYNYEISEEGNLIIKIDGVSGEANLVLSPVAVEDNQEQEEIVNTEKDTMVVDYFSDDYMVTAKLMVPDSYSITADFTFNQGVFEDLMHGDGYIKYVKEDADTVTLYVGFGQIIGEEIVFDKTEFPHLENLQAQMKHWGPGDYVLNTDEVYINFVEK